MGMLEMGRFTSISVPISALTRWVAKGRFPALSDDDGKGLSGRKQIEEVTAA